MHLPLLDVLDRSLRCLLRVPAVFLMIAALPQADAGSAAAATPPQFPDAARVYNGCHISATAYLAQFLAAFPGEQGRPLVLMLPNADGRARSHTVALVSWQGEWWCRDSYFGVVRTGCRADAEPNLDKVASHLMAAGRRCMANPAVDHPTEAPEQLSARDRLAEVATAVRLLPFPARVFWIKTKSGSLPFAFFRPAPNQIAVYDPIHGTCVADCRMADDAKVVGLVATKLGYRPLEVHAELTLAASSLVASAGGAR